MREQSLRPAIAALLAAAGLVASAAGSAAPPSPRHQQPQQQPQQQQQQQPQPTFRTATDLVVVDATVLDSSGKPLRNLALEDFSVSVDGQPRRVSTVQFIDRTARAAVGTTPTGVYFTTNQTGDTGRIIVLVIDQDTVAPGTLRAPAEVVDRLFAGFGASDKVGLIALPGPRKLVELGGSQQQIKDAMVRTPGSKGPVQRAYIKGTGAPGSTGAFRSLNIATTEAFRIDQGDSVTFASVVNRECRTGGTADRTDETPECQRMVEAESRRIVNQARNETTRFVSTLRGIMAALKPIDAPKILIVLSQGLSSPEAPREMVGLDRDAAAARTTIHALRLDRPMFDAENERFDAYRFEDRDALRAGLEAMVGRAGGTIFEVTGNGAPAFGRLADEMSGYYLIGLEPSASDRDGKSHNIDVKVGRKGVTVHNRPTFVFERSVATERAAVRDETKAVVDALKSPVIDNRVPVRVATFNMADSDPLMVRVLVSAEVDERQERADSAMVGFVIYDDAGKVHYDYMKRTELERLPSGALRLVTVGDVPPGPYTLRLATTRNGRVGSVEHHFTASLERAGGLRLGNLILANGRQPTAQLTPPVDGHLSTDRLFGFVQILGPKDAKAQDASFNLEIARNDTSPALVSAPLTPGAARSGLQAVTGVLDVSLLPPSEYRARLVVSIGGKAVNTLSAPLVLDAVPRRPPSVAGKGGRPPDEAAADTVPFNPADVLAPDVLGPFLDEMARNSPDVPETAVTAAKAGRFDEALAQLKGRTGDPVAAFVRGAGLYQKAAAATTGPDRKVNLEAAANAFRDAVSGSSASMVGAFYIGACYALGGKEQQAANAWQTSLAQLDGYAVVYRMLADALGRLGQAERQAQVLEEAITQWPNDDAFGRRLIRAEFAAGKYEQALGHIEAAIAKQAADEAMVFLALQTVYEMALDAPANRLPALVTQLERYRNAYVAAKGPRQALVDEWISYFKRRTPGTDLDRDSSSSNQG